MASRRFLAFALSIPCVVALTHCTSFGAGGDDPVVEDASPPRPLNDGQVTTDAPVVPSLDAGDSGQLDARPVGTADYNGAKTTQELPAAPPYAYIPGPPPRFFALALAGNLAREVTGSSPLPSLDWPVSRRPFAMLKVQNNDAARGSINGLVTSGLAADDGMEIGKQNPSGETGETNNGTAVAAVRGNVYFARAARGGAGEVAFKVIDTMTLEISSSAKVLTSPLALTRPFAVSDDELVLLRDDPASPGRVLLHRRPNAGSPFGAAEQRSIDPPLGPTDGILGFQGSSFFAYRVVGGKTIVFLYQPR